MFDIAARFAAALAVVAFSHSAFAAQTDLVDEPTVAVAVADESVEFAAYCEYVIVWDVWGNAYYELYCY